MPRRAALLVVVLSGLLAAAAAPAPDLSQVEGDQHEQERERDVALAEAEAARMQVLQLQAELDALSASARGGDRRISDKRLQLAALNAREAELDAQLGGAQGKLARLLGALELLRAEPPPALTVDPHDIRDAVRAAILIRALTPELQRRAQALRAQTLALQQLRRQVTSTSQELFISESQAAERRAKIESLIATKTKVEREAQAEAAAAGTDADALAAHARSLRGLSPEAATALASFAPPDPEHAGPGGAAKPFTAPAPGAPTRRFGDPQAGGRVHDGGWTWRLAPGTQVVAPAAGVVEFAEPLKGWGLVVILRLGGGYRVVLAGLDATTAAAGQAVHEGQPVGKMTQAANGGGDLYLEIRKDGDLVDPAHWLKIPDQQAGGR